MPESWTKREDNLVRRHYAEHGAVGLVDRLPGRTAVAIRNRAKRLGVQAAADGLWTEAKGHWKAGKARHPKMPAALKRNIRKLVSGAGRVADGEDRPPSIRSIAAEIGVSDRTLRRWLAGEDNPSPDHLARLHEIALR